jgi:MFS family permease
MPRLLMTVFGGLLCGLAAWAVVGFTAAQIFGKSGHDGGGAMGGFFVIGGMGGVLGAVLGAWGIWRLLADPARMGTVGGGLGALLVVLVIAVVYAMTPTYSPRSDFPEGKRGEFQAEAKFPLSRFEALGKQPRLTFELRGGGFFLETPAALDKVRKEAEQAVVPGTFRIQEVNSWLLAIMNGDTQLDTTTVGIDRFIGPMTESTEWSPWTPTNAGLEVRWRFAVLAK